jgi:hypothetical protein
VFVDAFGEASAIWEDNPANEDNTKRINTDAPKMYLGSFKLRLPVEVQIEYKAEEFTFYTPNFVS